MKKPTDKIKALRGEIEDMIRLIGLVETEEVLGIVIMGVRSRCW